MSKVCHAIERTSPMGGPFIGTCRLCGTPNLRMGDALKECPNQRGLSADEALLELLDQPEDVARTTKDTPNED
jgi:hypothetical protein